MSWQECRERFTALSKAVKELAGGAPLDSRTESLKGESNSREVANGEGTASSQQMSDHAKVTEEDCKLLNDVFSAVCSIIHAPTGPERGAQLLADAIRDARLKEAQAALTLGNSVESIGGFRLGQYRHVKELERGVA